MNTCEKDLSINVVGGAVPLAIWQTGLAEVISNYAYAGYAALPDVQDYFLPVGSYAMVWDGSCMSDNGVPPVLVSEAINELDPGDLTLDIIHPCTPSTGDLALGGTILSGPMGGPPPPCTDLIPFGGRLARSM